jgi:NADPH:quinone reductase-like Zn-dependent oxidoreductase
MIRVPKTMRAAAIDRFGPARALKLHTMPVPEISSTEVLIALDTAGVGSWDAGMRGGWWPEGKPRFPAILGTDGSGRVAAKGSRVRRFRVGDRVYAYAFLNSKGGFYAEYIAIRESKVGHVPRGLDLRKAGAVPVTGLTALQGVDALRLKRGETVLVHGASGGVGTIAVQFARWKGARVLATASGRSGAALVRRLGAEKAVDGKHANIAAAIRRFAPDGVDAILAFAGGEPLVQCLDALKPGGRLVYPNGVEPAPRKRKRIRVRTYDGTAGVRQFRELGRAIEASKLKVPILAAYRLADAARAHERLRKGRILGKIVLRIR